MAFGCEPIRMCRPGRALPPLVFQYPNHENGVVTTLTEPQVWVLIGVFTAAFFGMIGIVSTSLTRTMNSRFEAMDARLDAKFDIITIKLENMDRDIQALSRHVFGSEPRG